MEGKSEALTEGVRVAVSSQYLPQQSNAAKNRFVFTYSVVIENQGPSAVELKTRHWIITDAQQDIEEVHGEGVVGEQPKLAPGESFEYRSGCVLTTPWGTMNGSYQMVREDGSRFDAVIAPFLLVAPFVAPSGAPS